MTQVSVVGVADGFDPLQEGRAIEAVGDDGGRYRLAKKTASR